ncbi:MAG TPA: hypothetical protein VFJ95_12980 [Gammaproteobacteria bacterium]|nr:hypothetical protein [Gammaproteobacteria bacterium]
MRAELTVECNGAVVIARLRGEPTVELLKECQERVLSMARSRGTTKVLYDALEMRPPPVDVPWAQRQLDESNDELQLRRAVVVPCTKLAYLARLAFGDGDYRVFYDDMAPAVRWLDEATAA